MFIRLRAAKQSATVPPVAMTSGTSIRVALVEDNPVEREGLMNILKKHRDIECAAVCRTAQEALEMLPECRPDVVLMDINLEDESGINCVRKLRPVLRETQFMMLTIVEDHEKIFDSLSAGATGYLLKGTGPEKLIEAVRELHDGGSPMSGQIARHVIRAFQRDSYSGPAAKLTPAERQVLERLGRGLLYKEVAEELKVSIHTVQTHVWSIYRKLEVHNRTEAVLKGLGK